MGGESNSHAELEQILAHAKEEDDYMAVVAGSDYYAYALKISPDKMHGAVKRLFYAFMEVVKEHYEFDDDRGLLERLLNSYMIDHPQHYIDFPKKEGDEGENVQG